MFSESSLNIRAAPSDFRFLFICTIVNRAIPRPADDFLARRASDNPLLPPFPFPPPSSGGRDRLDLLFSGEPPGSRRFLDNRREGGGRGGKKARPGFSPNH